MAIAVLFGEQQSTKQVNCIVSSMHQAWMYRCGAANRRFGSPRFFRITRRDETVSHPLGQAEPGQTVFRDASAGVNAHTLGRRSAVPRVQNISGDEQISSSPVQRPSRYPRRRSLGKGHSRRHDPRVPRSVQSAGRSNDSGWKPGGESACAAGHTLQAAPCARAGRIGWCCPKTFAPNF
jgi:hypothetical protein